MDGKAISDRGYYRLLPERIKVTCHFSGGYAFGHPESCHFQIAEAIAKDGLRLAWVANCIDPNMAALEEKHSDLKTYLPAPCLGVVPSNLRIL